MFQVTRKVEIFIISYDDFSIFSLGETIPIDPCDCGGVKCYGSMRGFKNLPDDEKQRLLPHTLLNVRIGYFIEKKKKAEEKLNQE
jgi:hypothetical protein